MLTEWQRVGKNLEKNIDLYMTITGHAMHPVAFLVFLLLNLKIIGNHRESYPSVHGYCFYALMKSVVKFLMHCFHGVLENGCFKLDLITYLLI